MLKLFFKNFKSAAMFVLIIIIILSILIAFMLLNVNELHIDPLVLLLIDIFTFIITVAGICTWLEIEL